MKKLLFAFAFLILLTLLIGLVGISRIEKQSLRIENLGKHNLALESAVLEMRVNNTVYAMGIRNYVFWRAARYLSAAPMAINLEKILQAGDNFKKQLKAYQESAYLPQQKDWAGQIAASFDELLLLGAKITASVDNRQNEGISEAVNNYLMAFENRVYAIDSFLDTSMGKSNLREVQRQVSLAHTDKQQAIFFLKFSLIAALMSGLLIALSVYRRLIKERAYRQQLFNRMINVEEGERKKLSTAVHDEMGQDLSALKIYLGLVSQGLSEAVSLRGAALSSLRGAAGDEAISLKEKVDECGKIASGLVEKSHNIAFLLRPPDLDEVGLLESVESLLIESRHLTGVNYTFEKPKEKLDLAPEYSLLIYRLTQEFLTNMAKHAQAKNVELRMNRNGNFIELFYRDDGRGFDCNQDEQKFLRRKEDKFSFGLLGLKERVEVLDGAMRINSASGKGTSISVKFPV